LNVSADLVSSYIWRGLPGFGIEGDYSFFSPCIQPTLSFGNDHFEIGTWGSVNISGTAMEMDLFASLSYSKFSFIITDYFTSGCEVADYFNFDNKTTSHIIEAAIEYTGEKKPFLHVLAATMIYGADKKCDNIKYNNYSTYFEFGFNFKIKENDLDLFAGMTPFDGYYGDSYGGLKSFGVVNLGVTGNRYVQITDKFELPVSLSFITNPQYKRAFFVFTASI
jgi:hypothetical protein